MQVCTLVYVAVLIWSIFNWLDGSFNVNEFRPAHPASHVVLGYLLVTSVGLKLIVLFSKYVTVKREGKKFLLIENSIVLYQLARQ